MSYRVTNVTALFQTIEVATLFYRQLTSPSYDFGLARLKTLAVVLDHNQLAAATLQDPHCDAFFYVSFHCQGSLGIHLCVSTQNRLRYLPSVLNLELNVKGSDKCFLFITNPNYNFRSGVRSKIYYALII